MNTGDTGIAVIIGALLPMVISAIVQRGWSSRICSIVAFIVCAVASLASTVFTDTVQFKEPGFDWVTYFAAVYGTAMVTYARFYKPVGIAPTIRDHTNVGGG